MLATGSVTKPANGPKMIDPEVSKLQAFANLLLVADAYLLTFAAHVLPVQAFRRLLSDKSLAA